MTECAICGTPPEEHRRLEARGIINHQFSENGELNTVEKPKPVKARPQHEVLVVPGIDLPLRTLLIEKGILSADDFESAGSIPGFAAADRGPGGDPSAQGGMRIAPEHPEGWLSGDRAAESQ